jgi:hypothetical protein
MRFCSRFGGPIKGVAFQLAPGQLLPVPHRIVHTCFSHLHCYRTGGPVVPIYSIPSCLRQHISGVTLSVGFLGNLVVLWYAVGTCSTC